jgi:L-iditol 2-dehydrogenase
MKMEGTAMKAAVMVGPGEILIEERPVPKPKDDEVLVRIGAVGVCGSDAHYFKHGKIGRYIVDQPLILGHESAGTVVKIGKSVSHLQIGDRVALEPGVPCRRCDYCKTGRYNLCADVVFMATPPVDGVFCEYYSTPADFAFKLPDIVSLEEASMVEPLACGIHAIRRGRVQPGESVAVLGAGPIGLMVLQAAKAFGTATRVAFDIEPNRLELARNLGATHVFNPIKGDILKETLRVIPGGPDVVVEAAGGDETSILVTKLVRRGGRIVWMGNTMQDHVPMSVLEILDKEIDLLGTFRYANVYPQAIRLIETGLVEVGSMITHTFPLEQVSTALEMAYTRSDGSIKVVIKP